jgi:hypothetical protein
MSRKWIESRQMWRHEDAVAFCVLYLTNRCSESIELIIPVIEMDGKWIQL